MDWAAEVVAAELVTAGDETEDTGTDSEGETGALEVGAVDEDGGRVLEEGGGAGSLEESEALDSGPEAEDRGPGTTALALEAMFAVIGQPWRQT